MQIRWLEDAVEDLQALHQYIASDNPKAATDIAKKINHSVTHLKQHPAMGRPGRVVNTRELIIPNIPCIVPYRVKNNAIEILRVLHATMQWPEAL